MTESLPPNWDIWDRGRLIEEIRGHNERYWDQNSPTISDYDYDRLVERLRMLDPQAEILASMGPATNEPGSSVTHAAPMLSLDKAYDEATLLKWADKFSGDLVMTPKVDGVACSIRYNERGLLAVAATRGSGTVGEDITANVRRIANVPTRIKYSGAVELRGEVYMPLSTFENLKGDFANPRNTTAGALKQKNADRSESMGLRFFVYDVIGPEFGTELEKYEWASRFGLSPVEHRLIGRSQVQSGYDEYVARRDKLDFEIDGVVFKANRLEEQERLGATAHHPRYSIAYKLQGESAVTTLESVEWSVSRTGALTPVGIVDPVLLSGAMVTRISLHNWGLVQSKNISINARVVAMRRGGVIPHLESVVEPGDEMVFPPAECPSCGGRPVIDGDLVLCTNKMECAAQSVGVLAHYAKVAGIEGFGEVWLDTLVEAGTLSSPTDYYRLEASQLTRFDRMGDTLAQKLLEQIAATRTMPLAQFLQALGIPDLGKTASETLASHLQSLAAVREADSTSIEALPKFGALLATRIPRAIRDRSDLIDDLLQYIRVQDAAPVQPQGGPLEGSSFLFTGTLVSMARAEAQAQVKALGGTAASGVSKKLTYLVIGDAGKAGSKLKKAEALGIPILSEAEFMEHLSAAGQLPQ